MRTTDLAWAAGVYDGEGSASTYLPKGRKSRRRQMAVYQSGDGAPPPLLLRFRAVVGGVGLIHGPSRGRLYQWHSSRHDVVDGVAEMLWPWLSDEKRAQFDRAAREVHRPPTAAADASWTEPELAAWAAGFFDGEGTIGVYGDPRRPFVQMSLPQASDAGVPGTLERFLVAVGAGAINGPHLKRSPWSRLPQYRWELARFAEIERIATLLRPYADTVKRAQMDAAVARVRETRAQRARTRSGHTMTS